MKAGEAHPYPTRHSETSGKVHAGSYRRHGALVAACTGHYLTRETLVELEEVPAERRCRRLACAIRWEAEGCRQEHPWEAR